MRILGWPNTERRAADSLEFILTHKITAEAESSTMSILTPTI
jgi:hypothetical protein